MGIAQAFYFLYLQFFIIIKKGIWRIGMGTTWNQPNQPKIGWTTG
jgi:hypothetical protein